MKKFIVIAAMFAATFAFAGGSPIAPDAILQRQLQECVAMQNYQKKPSVQCEFLMQTVHKTRSPKTSLRPQKETIRIPRDKFQAYLIKFID